MSAGDPRYVSLRSRERKGKIKGGKWVVRDAGGQSSGIDVQLAHNRGRVHGRGVNGLKGDTKIVGVHQ